MFALVEDLLSSGLSRDSGKRGSWGMRIQIREEPACNGLSKETHWLRAHDGGLSEGDGDVQQEEPRIFLAKVLSPAQKIVISVS